MYGTKRTYSVKACGWGTKLDLHYLIYHYGVLDYTVIVYYDLEVGRGYQLTCQGCDRVPSANLVR